DARGHVYAAVRHGVGRVRVFDENGKVLDEWPGPLDPNRVMVTQDQSVWVNDGEANRLAKFDLSGRLLTSFGTGGEFPGGFAFPHDFSVDSEGNLYVSNGYEHRFDKYVPKKGADRNRLVGQPYVARATSSSR